MLSLISLIGEAVLDDINIAGILVLWHPYF